VISGEKILVTGPAGRIAFGIAKSLSERNEVWGIARFSDPAKRREVEELGVTTRSIDLLDPDLSDLPADFSYLVHIAVAYENDYDRALRANGESTGLLLEHCRKAKAALVMSSCSVYKPEPDPYYAYREQDALGDPLTHAVAPYPLAKISQEVVARYCARSLGLPVTIARMNCAYGKRGGLPLMQFEEMLAGRPIVTRWDPCVYSPIFDTDIEAQLEPLLQAASVPATIVNWGGDELVSVQEWARFAGSLLGVTPVIEVRPIVGGPGGMVADNAKRLSITGPGTVSWQDGFRQAIAACFPWRLAGEPKEAR
jgi:nucleoside-diphosphate-sugar epimerase